MARAQLAARIALAGLLMAWGSRPVSELGASEPKLGASNKHFRKPPQGDADSMFTVKNPVPDEKAAGSVEDTGCKMQWPA